MAELKCKGSAGSADVYVKLPTGRTVNLDLKSTDTVAVIYSRVAEEEGVPVDRILIKYTGKVLKESQSVGFLGICAETILKAEIIQVKSLSVYVKLPGGKTLTVQIENISQVKDLQEYIHAHEHILPSQQVLQVPGTTITNTSQKLFQVGIHDETVVTLEVKSKAASPKVKAKALGKSKAARRDSTGSGPFVGESAAAEAEVPADLGEDDKQAILSSFNSCGNNVEVVFSFDTTGSMYSCLEEVRVTLRDTVKRLVQHIPNIRIGIIAHGDYCDHKTYVIKMEELTSDVDKLCSFVKDVPATGGGDAPEAYEWVLRRAQTLDWAEDSAKALVMIGDDQPHCVSYTDQVVNWHEELDVLTGMGVKIYGVRAQHGSRATPFYQELADRSGGAYIEFKNFSIITEMFLAVCYREASNEQFEDFCQEVMQQVDANDTAAHSRQTDLRSMLTQLEEQKKIDPEEKPKRYIAEPWWDPQLDHGSTPSYSYSALTNRWSNYGTVSHAINRLTSCLTFHDDVSPLSVERKSTRRSSHRLKKKGACSIM